MSRRLTAERVAQGLAKISLVLRQDAWQQAGARGLTPTQGQVLCVLSGRREGPGVGEVARALGVTSATASEAVGALVGKGLVEKRVSEADGRGVELRLTREGGIKARQLAGWPDYLVGAIGDLSEAQQGEFLRLLVRMIRGLQERGAIPVQRMCVECRYFAANVHDDPGHPHHCRFVDAPLGDGELRLDCPDQESVAGELREANWELFIDGKPTAGKSGKGGRFVKGAMS